MTTRRRFLRAGATLAIGLPWLESLTRTAQAAGEFPQRILYVIGSNGVEPSQWIPTQNGRDFTLPFSLEPLDGYRDRMIVYRGLQNASARNQGGNPHTKAGSHTLTGARHIDGQFTKGGGGGFSTRISVDQEIANAMDTPVRSLVTGVDIGSGSNGETPRERFSYRGRNEPVQPRRDAAQVFNSLVDYTGGGDDGSAELVLRARAERRSVLDFAIDDLEQLNTQVSAIDRARLDQHLTQLRTIEQSIAELPDPSSVAAECSELANPGGQGNIPTQTRNVLDLIAFAFRCDITRVATFQWAGAQSAIRYNGVVNNVPSEAHHGISHNDGNNYSGPMGRIARFQAEHVAYVADLLDAMPEGEGSVLDNTILVHLNTLSVGNSHDFRNLPILTIGSGGGVLDVGQVASFNGRAINDFHLTMARAMGLGIDSFGDPEWVDGPLGVLT